MSTTQTIVSNPPMTVSPEVQEYANKHGISETLQCLLEATPRIYPTATSIRVYLKQDVSIEDLWFLTFEVRVPAADIPDHVQAKRRWGDEWARAYPTPRLHSFVLRLVPVDA